MHITLDKFSRMIPTNPHPEQWYNIILDMFKKYNINTINRISGFMSQTGHESSDFTIVEENLNYSADRLNVIFPKYFINAGRDSNLFARQPENIANVVYANRLGNGDINSGDGWNFRGRGLIQLTGKYNYTNFGKSIGKNPYQVIDYIKTKQGSVESSCWFWKNNNLEIYADADDIIELSKRVNGGSNGLNDRIRRYNNIKTLLNTDSTSDFVIGITLKLGSTGNDVKKMQEKLNITQDGIFGKNTEKVLKEWQSKNNLTPDGIAGPKTLKLLLG